MQVPSHKYGEANVNALYRQRFIWNSRIITTMATTENRKQLHVAIIPWLAFGHILPFLELSKYIAQIGHKVSFLSTTRNIQRLPTLPFHLSHLINLVKLTLPRVHELPEDAEATTDVHTHDLRHLIKAFDGLQPEVTGFLEQESPDWIIYDFTHHWLPSVAADLGISRAFFITASPWFMAHVGPLPDDMKNSFESRTTVEDFMTPPKWIPFPSKVCYRKHEFVRKMSAANNPVISGLKHRMMTVLKESDCLFIRSCYEVEPQWLTLLGKLYRIPVVPVGLMPPETYGDEKDDTWVSVKKWLDGQQVNHVVYVALGSEVTVTKSELAELALGLELSGLPFLWVLRKPAGSTESDSVELPNGFLERTSNRGMVWTSWAPQLRILSHESVCGFLTHCGWSSVVEGLMFGHPLIMLPIFGDQCLNARLLADKQVGIEIPRNEEDGYFTKESVATSLRSVVVDDEGEIYKANAREMSKIFSDTKLQKEYISRFTDYMEKNVRVVANNHES